jgi:hypothetical protein
MAMKTAQLASVTASSELFKTPSPLRQQIAGSGEPVNPLHPNGRKQGNAAIILPKENAQKKLARRQRLSHLTHHE